MSIDKQIVPIEKAIEIFAFDGLPEHDRNRRTAYQLPDGSIRFRNTDDDEEWNDVGRWELAGEIICAAIMSGKLQLYGATTPPESDSTGETHTLWQIPLAVVRRGVLDRWDGDLVLVRAGRDVQRGAASEVTNLHLDAAQFDAFCSDLMALRHSQVSDDGGGSDDKDATPILRVVSGTIGAERECEEWLRARISGAPNDRPTKENLWKEAASHFGERLSKRGFIRVWDNHAPDAWRRAGPKGKTESKRSG